MLKKESLPPEINATNFIKVDQAWGVLLDMYRDRDVCYHFSKVLSVFLYINKLLKIFIALSLTQ